jgi:hypothetical protein
MKYSNELLEEIKADLGNGLSISEICNNRDIGERSLIAKLSSMGLYKKQPYLTKQGVPSVRKSELVDKIGELIGEDIEALDSLEKCNKRVLELLIKHLTC